MENQINLRLFRSKILPEIRRIAEDPAGTRKISSRELKQLLVYLDELEEIVLDVAMSGIEFEDYRLKYLTIQLSKDTWAQIQRLLICSGLSENDKPGSGSKNAADDASSAGKQAG